MKRPRRKDFRPVDVMIDNLIRELRGLRGDVRLSEVRMDRGIRERPPRMHESACGRYFEPDGKLLVTIRLENVDLIDSQGRLWEEVGRDE